MKNMFLRLALVAGLAIAVGTTARAAEGKETKEGKEVTIKGKAVCAKCEFHKADKCQNAVITKKGDKEVVYYLTGDKSGAFHKNVCKEGKDVVAKGTVKKDEDGKMVMNVSEIHLAKHQKSNGGGDDKGDKGNGAK